MFSPSKAKLLRAVIIGGKNTGKTTLIKRLSKDRLISENPTSSGSHAYLLQLNSSTTIQLWDISASCEASHKNRILKNANIFILVFDVTNPKNVAEIKAFFENLQTIPIKDQAQIIITCHKMDLFHRFRLDAVRSIHNVAARENCVIVETSAFFPASFEKIFQCIKEYWLLKPEALVMEKESKPEALSCR